jgi:hypothetical protein
MLSCYCIIIFSKKWKHFDIQSKNYYPGLTKFKGVSSKVYPNPITNTAIDKPMLDFLMEIKFQFVSVRARQQGSRLRNKAMRSHAN